MDVSYGSAKYICTDIGNAARGNDMVIISPDPLNPGTYPGYPLTPWIEPYPQDPEIHWNYYYPVEEKKKWKERHIKDVRKGIFITFDDDSDPVFIATDDACFDKIMKAIKE